MVAEGDISVEEFVNLIDDLPEHPPVTTEMDPDSSDDPKIWYSSQREHMIAWFLGQMTKGEGAYSRETPNYSSKVTYNRLQCPPALIWIAEVLGVDPKKLRPVALKAREMDRRTACGFIRKQVPWDDIYTLIQAKQQAPTKPARATKTRKFESPKRRFSIEIEW